MEYSVPKTKEDYNAFLKMVEETITDWAAENHQSRKLYLWVGAKSLKYYFEDIFESNKEAFKRFINENEITTTIEGMEYIQSLNL